MIIDLQYFGGRGAGSSRGGGGSLGELPELEGSAKQIAWAEDIRGQYKRSLDKYLNKDEGSTPAEKRKLDGFRSQGEGDMQLLTGMISRDKYVRGKKKAAGFGFQNYRKASKIGGDTLKKYEERRRTVGKELTKKAEAAYKRELLKNVKKAFQNKSSKFWIDHRLNRFYS